jgi:hypothetical protein
LQQVSHFLKASLLSAPFQFKMLLSSFLLSLVVFGANFVMCHFFVGVVNFMPIFHSAFMTNLGKGLGGVLVCRLMGVRKVIS